MFYRKGRMSMPAFDEGRAEIRESSASGTAKRKQDGTKLIETKTNRVTHEPNARTLFL